MSTLHEWRQELRERAAGFYRWTDCGCAGARAEHDSLSLRDNRVAQCIETLGMREQDSQLEPPSRQSMVDGERLSVRAAATRTG